MEENARRRGLRGAGPDNLEHEKRSTMLAAATMLATRETLYEIPVHVHDMIVDANEKWTGTLSSKT